VCKTTSAVVLWRSEFNGGSKKHILIIAMTDAIGLRNIHILKLPIQTYMYLSKL
jgi:hypothetical protein